MISTTKYEQLTSIISSQMSKRMETRMTNQSQTHKIINSNQLDSKSDTNFQNVEIYAKIDKWLNDIGVFTQRSIAELQHDYYDFQKSKLFSFVKCHKAKKTKQRNFSEKIIQLGKDKPAMASLSLKVSLGNSSLFRRRERQQKRQYTKGTKQTGVSTRDENNMK